MNRRLQRMILAITACALILSAGRVQADEAIPASPLTRVSHAINPMNWRMPEWKMPNFSGILPAKEDKARIKKKKDGLFSDVSATASKSWTKTKETLHPKNLNPVRFLPASARTPSKPKPKSDSPGFFGSLFSPPAQPKQSGTVTDFLGQDKPRG